MWLLGPKVWGTWRNVALRGQFPSCRVNVSLRSCVPHTECSQQCCITLEPVDTKGRLCERKTNFESMDMLLNLTWQCSQFCVYVCVLGVFPLASRYLLALSLYCVSLTILPFRRVDWEVGGFVTALFFQVDCLNSVTVSLNLMWVYSVGSSIALLVSPVYFCSCQGISSPSWLALFSFHDSLLRGI